MDHCPRPGETPMFLSGGDEPGEVLIIRIVPDERPSEHVQTPNLDVPLLKKRLRARPALGNGNKLHSAPVRLLTIAGTARPPENEPAGSNSGRDRHADKRA
jgi:hypothetical protein